jgi:hypothetical protein
MSRGIAKRLLAIAGLMVILILFAATRVEFVYAAF